MSTFLELGVRKDFHKALKELNILNPTEIQEETIPKLLHSKVDFIEPEKSIESAINKIKRQLKKAG